MNLKFPPSQIFLASYFLPLPLLVSNEEQEGEGIRNNTHTQSNVFSFPPSSEVNLWGIFSGGEMMMVIMIMIELDLILKWSALYIIAVAKVEVEFGRLRVMERDIPILITVPGRKIIHPSTRMKKYIIGQKYSHVYNNTQSRAAQFIAFFSLQKIYIPSHLICT